MSFNVNAQEVPLDDHPPVGAQRAQQETPPPSWQQRQELLKTDGIPVTQWVIVLGILGVSLATFFKPKKQQPRMAIKNEPLFIDQSLLEDDAASSSKADQSQAKKIKRKRPKKKASESTEQANNIVETETISAPMNGSSNGDWQKVNGNSDKSRAVSFEHTAAEAQAKKKKRNRKKTKSGLNGFASTDGDADLAQQLQTAENGGTVEDAWEVVTTKKRVKKVKDKAKAKEETASDEVEKESADEVKEETS